MGQPVKSGSMATFISIIKLDGGAASYRVVEGSGSAYTAYLIKNTSAASVPGEVLIDPLQGLRTGSDPLADRLLAAVRSTVSMGEEGP